jgi:hypothetical protein
MKEWSIFAVKREIFRVNSATVNIRQNAVVHVEHHDGEVIIISAVKTLTAILVVVLQSGLAYAQERQSFATLEIGLQYTANINRNVFHDFYDSGKGIEGFVAMPFYYGDIQATIQVLSYDAREKSQGQNFECVSTTLKWGKRYSMPDGVRWFTGIGIGLYAFLPGNPTWSVPYKVAHFTETELCGNLNTHLSYPIYENWTMRFEVSYNRIFTYKPIDLVYFSTGISYSFDTPKWMQVFLE